MEGFTFLPDAVEARSEARVRCAPYVPWMALVTLVYLTFEIGFNARLLDVTGGDPSHDEILSIERWGRLISGIAVTLAVWGMIILPWAMPRTGRQTTLLETAALLIASGLVCTGLVFHFEGNLIDGIVESSSGEQRRVAAHLEVISSAVVAGSAKIAGLDVPADELSDPAGKTFLSVFPFVALSTPNLTTKTEAIVSETVRRITRTKWGPPEKAYNDVFIPSVSDVYAEYDRYADGSRRLHDALAGIGGQQTQAWKSYVWRLRRHRLSPGGVPRRYWPRVAADVRYNGVDVPQGWNPGDRATFNRVIDDQIRGSATDEFRNATMQAVGTPLAAGLTREQFIADANVQQKWRQAIQAPDGVTLAPEMGFSSYRDRVFQPRLESSENTDIANLLSSPEDFANGGKMEEKGRRAMQMLVVPPIALAFSLVGALVHTFKTARFLAEWIRPWQRRRVLKIGIPVLFATYMVFFVPNPVSESNAFAALVRQTEQGWRLGPMMAVALRWTVKAQPIFYPKNEWVRRVLLGGFQFGYDPDRANRAADKV